MDIKGSGDFFSPAEDQCKKKLHNKDARKFSCSALMSPRDILSLQI